MLWRALTRPTPDIKPRVVLDLSLLIQGCLGDFRYLREKYVMGNELSFSEDTAPEVRVFVAASLGTYTVIVSPSLLDEWERVRRRAHWKGQFDEEPGVAIEAVLRSPEVITVAPDRVDAVCRDPGDDYLIATARAGEAEFIVSSDKDLTDLVEYEGIRLVTAATFLSAIT